MLKEEDLNFSFQKKKDLWWWQVSIAKKEEKEEDNENNFIKTKGTSFSLDEAFQEAKAARLKLLGWL